MNLWQRTRADRALQVPGARSSPGPIPAGGPNAAHQCDGDALMTILRGLIDRRPTGVIESAAAPGFALFFVELRRSDRTQALAALETARIVGETICRRVADVLRPQDRFALCGVDDILLLLPEVDSPGRALLVASRLVQALQQPMPGRADGMRVRPAIGCALFPAHGDDAADLIAAADRAARAARTTEECYQLATPSERSAAVAPLTNALEDALKANQLQVWLQPQLNLRTGAFDAAEALIRWPRPDGVAPVSPIATVELAEANGMMPELTLFVLNTVLRQSALLAQRGVSVRMSINVSASMLTDRDLPLTVQQALALWDVPPDRLTLEVTENTMMRDVERSLAILHALKEVGTHLSLDDFGTGYSSFAYLRRMPLDELKIDQLFVRNLSVLPDGSVNPQRAGDLRIVRSIVDIAHNFDLHTVAEGVEDAATLDLLKNLGCDVIQGYFTGRPMPLAEFGPWWLAQQAAVTIGEA